MVIDRVMVWDGVRRLPPKQRAPLVATKMYGFTQDETARLVKRHPGTVAVHISRALETLGSYFVGPPMQARESGRFELPPGVLVWVLGYLWRIVRRVWGRRNFG